MSFEKVFVSEVIGDYFCYRSNDNKTLLDGLQTKN